MVSVFKENLRRIIGDDFEEKEIVKEAFTQSGDFNRPLAEVGDSVLNLVVKRKAYCRMKDPQYIDDMRKKYADKYANQLILNQDVSFTRYLNENRYTNSPVGGIGVEKADRFVEAIIGAIYFSEGFDVASKFTLELLMTNEHFMKEFS